MNVVVQGTLFGNDVTVRDGDVTNRNELRLVVPNEVSNLFGVQTTSLQGGAVTFRFQLLGTLDRDMTSSYTFTLEVSVSVVYSIA